MANLSYIEDNRIISKINENKKVVGNKIDSALWKFWVYSFFLGIPVLVLLISIYPRLIILWIILTVSILKYVYKYFEGMSAETKDKNEILYAGAYGELQVLNELKKLDDENYILNQVFVPDVDSSTGYRELDYIVIGPGGCTVIDVKNLNGRVVGDEDDAKWELRKVGRFGGEYSKQCRNPVKQVNKATKLLSNAVTAKGLNVDFEPIIAFANSNPLNSITTRTVKVVQMSELVNILRSKNPRPIVKPAKVADAIYNISSQFKSNSRNSLPNKLCSETRKTYSRYIEPVFTVIWSLLWIYFIYSGIKYQLAVTMFFVILFPFTLCAYLIPIYAVKGWFSPNS